ncbi:MAG TPA: Hpt domain-containing protein [Rhodopila sp.]|nr:Hpt domain-containing protein [Rhodopila sp.]
MENSSQPEFVTQLAEFLSPEDVNRALLLLRGDLLRLSGDMQAAVQAGDEKAFRGAAHAMCGAAASVGLEPLERICRAAMTRPDLGSQMSASAAEIMALASQNLTEIAAFLAAKDSPAS